MSEVSPSSAVAPLPSAASAPLPSASAASTWRTTIIGWHWALYGVAAIGLVSSFTLQDIGSAQRWLAAAVFVVLALAYTVLVVPDPFEPNAKTATYLVIAIVATGVVCAIHYTLSLLLFIVYPQMWILNRVFRRGLASTAALTLAALIGYLFGLGFTSATMAAVVPSLAVSLGFSVLLGWWISRIVEQSRERAELIDALTAARAQLAEAHHAQGVMAERERVAREIHDTLAQGFTSVVMLAQAAAAQAAAGHDPAGRLAAIEDVARENLSEARALVAAYTPVGLSGATLGEALQRLGSRFAEQTGLAVSVDVQDGLGPLAREQEVVLLRAVQEALTNVRRHADARAVTIRLSADQAGAHIEVDDDGVGFSPITASAATGFGLAGMRSRVDEIGGDVSVTSAPGEGTRVRVRVPLALPSGGSA